jgi:hypothetical protein
MARCPSCEYPIPDDRERVGARCPNCRDPLYEPPGRNSRPAREDEADCAAHAGMESVGQCARCKLHLCEVCRTRWRGQILCAACVDKALAGSEATPEQARSQARQTFLSLALGVGAWLLAGLALLALDQVNRLTGGKAPVGLTFVVFLIVAGNALAAAVGVGQAVAALRQRGERQALALVGLVLGGLYAGALLGAGTFFVWQN